jgi:hypothetical protein
MGTSPKHNWRIDFATLWYWNMNRPSHVAGLKSTPILLPFLITSYIVIDNVHIYIYTHTYIYIYIPSVCFEITQKLCRKIGHPPSSCALSCLQNFMAIHILAQASCLDKPIHSWKANCLPTHLPIYLSNYASIYLSVCLSIFSIYVSTYLSTYLFTYLLI